MAENKIVQRLIAAGATPERAQQFAQDFAKKQAEKTTSVSRRNGNVRKPVPGTPKPPRRPQDIEDAFDAQIAALSAAYYPMTFKPPKPGAPNYDDYVKFVMGEVRQNQIIDRTYVDEAPNYTAAIASIPQGTPYENLTTPEQKIVYRIAEGKPFSEIYGELSADITLLNVLDPGQIGGMINKFIAEKQTAETQIKNQFDAFLESDPYYKVALPDPRLKYGEKENLAAGVIDVRTHPTFFEYSLTGVPKVKAPKEQYTPYGPSLEVIRESVSTQTPGGWVKQLEADQQTPFKDEVYRREFLKNPKKTTIYPR